MATTQPQPVISPGRILTLLANFAYAAGAFAADFNETHVCTSSPSFIPILKHNMT